MRLSLCKNNTEYLHRKREAKLIFFLFSYFSTTSSYSRLAPCCSSSKKRQDISHCCSSGTSPTLTARQPSLSKQIFFSHSNHVLEQQNPPSLRGAGCQSVQSGHQTLPCNAQGQYTGSGPTRPRLQQIHATIQSYFGNSANIRYGRLSRTSTRM